MYPKTTVSVTLDQNDGICTSVSLQKDFMDSCGAMTWADGFCEAMQLIKHGKAKFTITVSVNCGSGE